MTTNSNFSKTFFGKSIFSLDQFSREDIKNLFCVADKMKLIVQRNGVCNLLKRKVIAFLFFEPSSRTFSSFVVSAKRLGAKTLEYQDISKVSSVAKGETLEDTIEVFSQYTDAIVMRHHETGALSRVVNKFDIPIINAGDGSGEHPTQTFLDLYTLQNRFSSLDNIKGLIAGDLLNGRTVHSLLKGLSLFNNPNIYLLSPPDLKISRDLFNYIKNKGITLTEIESEKDIPKDIQFWYWTRVQKERFTDLDYYESIKNRYIITQDFLDKYANKNMIIMHPLPRVGEIDPAIDNDERTVYLRDRKGLSSQVKNGMFIRMALFYLIFADEKFDDIL